MTAAGTPIGNSYADLYGAMCFNREMKYNLLHEGKNHMRRLKAHSSQDRMEEEIYFHMIIADMIQKDKEPDDENMLDILEKLGRSMDPKEFDGLLCGFGEFLREYCSFMFDGDEVKALAASRGIRDAIAGFSGLYAKRQELGYREETLLSAFLDLYEDEELLNSDAGLTKVFYDSDDPDAPKGEEEPGERVIYLDDFDDLA